MQNNLSEEIISNEEINIEKLENAKKIILQLQNEMSNYIANGSAITDKPPFEVAFFFILQCFQASPCKSN